MQHTLIAKVENKPGVLNRVASLFRRRNFNIESLNVGQTENPDISRMTIVVENKGNNAKIVEANLYKLVNVIDVQDLTNQPTVTRDLALIKVKVDAIKRAEVVNLANIFRAKIVDVASDSVIVEIAGTEEKIEGLVELLSPFGILEMVRTGQVAMMRGDSPGVRHTPGANGHQSNNNKNTKVN
ncbi:MAG: acetolactate synthase small subunit [Chloroflexi bacterium]|jgi:acetolactate synthase I/III small subunit|nr:acetolactate synthase small subunit [Chloroflexota bacterium]MBT4002094.1 acetolactate synthase small subunit [Chloroflexota bacterium]MBT4305671.1 acetolactate synthase small subunit [Chloroflexota bacterium]MBT4533495.1 acetolactate synthase small subunit [Chloroflexota bacterium]MBT4681862.1 acetolactate synthase small subunit [Chloroflexota bacterium]